MKINFAIKNYFNIGGKLQFCTFLNLLIIFIISSALLISWLLIGLLFELELFNAKSFILMSSTELWDYVMEVFLFFIVITIIAQIIFYIKYLEQNPIRVELELSEYLDKLVRENRIKDIYNLMFELKALNMKLDDILFDTLNDDTKEKLRLVYNTKIK